MNSERKILFVRSGGGMPGLDIHAGMWLALARNGIRATHCSGTSAGALVSAFQAASWMGAIDFVDMLAALDDSDVRAERFAWKMRVPWIEYWMENCKILALLNHHLCPDYAELRTKLMCWAVNVKDGMPRNVADAGLAKTPALAALASMSICGVFAPVRLRDGNDYVDGGVAANLPLPPGLAEFDEVWLLVATGRPDRYSKNSSMLTRLIQNADWLMDAQVRAAIMFARKCSNNVRVIWPDLPTPNGALHFDHTLIAKADRWTQEFLSKEGL